MFIFYLFIGSGKSSILSAILGDMICLTGSVNVHPSAQIAYVPQQAWIFNDTVRNNIVFGLPWDEQQYIAAVKSSQLVVDIQNQFAAGDETEIGEKGINLSGGQKQRISIARAVYRCPNYDFL